MPFYDYLCCDCGPFTDIRPMAEYDAPGDCPRCDARSPRVLLTAPQLSSMPGGKRLAHAMNERSSQAPKTLGEYKATHGPGCGCCAPSALSRLTKTKNGAKSFPTARPWMISH